MEVTVSERYASGDAAPELPARNVVKAFYAQVAAGVLLAWLGGFLLLPRPAGWLEYRGPLAPQATLASLQELVPARGDVLPEPYLSTVIDGLTEQGHGGGLLGCPLMRVSVLRSV